MATKARPYSREILRGDSTQRIFTPPNLLQIALPLGGIGAGCISLNGYGGLQDFSIHGQPSLTAMPDGHSHNHSAFALLHIKGARPVTKLVEGPLPVEKIYDQGLQGQGYRHGGAEGLPRFAECLFKGEFPCGEVTLHDSDVPLAVGINGWSPFIPLDDKNSSIPCAILEYTFTNRSRRTVDFEFSYHLSHLAVSGRTWEKTRNTIIPGSGIHFTNTEAPNSPDFGSASLSVVGHKPAIKGMWFRGGWFDALSVLWREVSEGRFAANAPAPVAIEARNGGSIMLAGSLAPGATVTYPIVITWYFPNRFEAHGQAEAAPACCPGGACDSGSQPPVWRPYYAGQWQHAPDVAAYVRQNYASLRARTFAFKNAFFASTLPSYVLDAASATLGVLKSPTVLREENGNVWAWEGCFVGSGCCHGTCTHVWNYAQAMPHLFPQLERTLREQELQRSMDERGHVNFRAALPDGPTPHTFHAAADGQLGGIMKVFRDWQICGDRAWLERMFPAAKRSLDYCIRTWDPDHKGALFEPHHNTYDIEFWGPDGMCTSIYLGALTVMAAICRELGHDGDAEFYKEIAAKGARFLDDELFNGDYFYHKVMWKGLRDKSFTQQITEAPSAEVRRLLRSEGPKYQYGTGCLADGVIGAWMARIYGIATPQSTANVRKHLKAIFNYNFRADLSDHACTQRPGYATGHEAGLLLCTWPHDDKPLLPFPYSEEDTERLSIELRAEPQRFRRGGIAKAGERS